MRLVVGMIGMIAAALLVGCETPPKDTAKKEESKWVRKDAPVDAGKTVTPTPVPAVVNKDPKTFDFESMSIKLTPAEEARVALLVEQAKSATTISIRGFCNRNEVGNAKDAAIARANAVREVLVKGGVPSSKIRLRFTTDEARHAAVVEFQ